MNPFESDPDKLAEDQEKLMPIYSEVIQLAGMMKAARDANNGDSGEKIKAKLYALVLSTTIGAKSRDELLVLASCAISLVATFAEKLTDTMAESLPGQVEEMLREGKL